MRRFALTLLILMAIAGAGCSGGGSPTGSVIPSSGSATTTSGVTAAQYAQAQAIAAANPSAYKVALNNYRPPSGWGGVSDLMIVVVTSPVTVTGVVTPGASVTVSGFNISGTGSSSVARSTSGWGGVSASVSTVSDSSGNFALPIATAGVYLVIVP